MADKIIPVVKAEGEEVEEEDLVDPQVELRVQYLNHKLLKNNSFYDLGKVVGAWTFNLQWTKTNITMHAISVLTLYFSSPLYIAAYKPIEACLDLYLKQFVFSHLINIKCTFESGLPSSI